MCGIVAAFNKNKDVNEDVLLQFEDQSSRGTNGFGSIFLDEEGKFNIMRATGQIKAILDIKLQPTKMLIFHHRQPSSSKNKISQTHPILISSGDLKYEYYIVHNGVIYNDDERKKYHEKELGYKYSTDVEISGWYGEKETMYNDSEILGYDIARFIEGQTDKIETAGSAAFIMVQVTKKDQRIRKVFYGRNESNPLKLAKSRDYLFLSSEGKGEDIKPDMLYSFSPDNFKITKRKMAIPSSRIQSNEPADKDHKKDESKDEVILKRTSFDKYNRDVPYDRTISSYQDPNEEWMSFEEEEELEKYFTSAHRELDELLEDIKDSKGEQIYLIDSEEAIRNIAINISQGLEYARQLKIANYMANSEDDGTVREIEEDYPGQEKDSKKILEEGETVELPEKTSAK